MLSCRYVHLSFQTSCKLIGKLFDDKFAIREIVEKFVYI